MLLAAASIALLLWCGVLLQTLRHPRLSLPDLTPEAPISGWPSLTVIFAALNEEETIERATRSMLALDYPKLTVIAVNDRSTDKTGEILGRLADGEPRLKVVTISELPTGWLGKTNALHQAWQSASSDYILFTDADVIFAPDALRRAVAHAVTTQADHMSLLPTMPLESFGERLFMTFFSLMFAIKFGNFRVENPRDRGYIGIGAFSLVRRAALAALGGIKPIRMSVDDDMRLGEAFKVNGYRLRSLQAAGLVSVKWQQSTLGYIKGVEKNAYASMNFSPAEFAFGTIGLFIAGAAPHAALLFGPSAATRLVGAAGLLVLCVLLYLARHITGSGWWHAFFTPLGAIVMQTALTNSLIKTYLRGGIVWRGHLYPLAALREHIRERNAWTNEAWRRHKPR